MIKRFVLCSLVSMAVACGTARAQEPASFTVEQAVALALDKNFDLSIQRENTSTFADVLAIAKSDFDPTFSLAATKSYSAYYPSNGSNSSTSTQSNFDTRVGVSQRISTGATLSATGSLDRARYNPVFSAINPVYNSDVSLSVTQPLLKNAGSTVSLAQIKRAKLGVTKAGHDLTSTVLSVVRSVEASYFNVAYAREQLSVRQFSLEVAQKLLEEAQTRLKTGVATDIDVLQAEVGVANARRILLNAEQQLKNSEDNLVSLIRPFEFGALPGVPALPEVSEAPVSFDLSYKQARENSPDYASAQVSTTQSQIDLDVARRNRLPQLDLGATLGYNAREASASRATSRVLGNDAYNWQVGATLTIPWGQRGDKARLHSAQSALTTSEIRVRQVEQNLTVDVRAAVRAVETARETVKITALATQLSKRQYEMEKARYDAGVSTFRRVQEVKEDWDTARINELQSSVDLRNALADLARLEASSLTRYHIAVK